MYNTVIFDMDGTLINSDDINMQSLQKAILRLESRFIPMDVMKKVSGMPGMKCIEGLGVNPKIADDIFKQWDIEFFNLNHQYAFFDGIVDVIDKLIEKGIYIGIVTSRSAEEYDNFFAHLGLKDKFELIVYASDTEKHKPHPEPILKFLDLSKRDPKSAIYIGDTVYDRDAATSAGIDFGLAGWNWHEVDANIVIKKPADILDMV